MKVPILFAITVAVFLSACAALPADSGEITVEVGTVLASTVGPPATPESPTALPTLQSALLPTELKYRVLDQFPDFFFCDPDYFPIAFADEAELARQRFPEVQANHEEFQAILDRNGLRGLPIFTDDQKLLIYREHKKLAAIYFELERDKFKFQIQTGAEGQEGYIISGAIDGRGEIDIQKREPSFLTCPICLSQDTLIDTPQGMIPVQDLQVGDIVWTMSPAGERIPAPILKTARVAVPANHQIIHVVLEDEREFWASPGHPTVDGRSLVYLSTGDVLDGAYIILIERLMYKSIATYDILPSGSTGSYWANGILLGSTLMRR